MKLIVGLGNVGKKYDNTRHNIGFMCLDEFAFIQNEKFTEKFNALMCQVNINGNKAILIKPTTFMNLSGEAVRKYADYYNIDVENILVIQDDLDLTFGTTKLKYNSSSGGQNGIKSIISHLKTQEFLRFKVGINNEYKKNAASFVLSNFTKDEKNELSNIYQKSNNLIEDFILGDDRQKLMNKYN